MEGNRGLRHSRGSLHGQHGGPSQNHSSEHMLPGDCTSGVHEQWQTVCNFTPLHVRAPCRQLGHVAENLLKQGACVSTAVLNADHRRRAQRHVTSGGHAGLPAVVLVWVRR